MKIEATPEEIADLVLALQGRQTLPGEVEVKIDGQALGKAIRDTLQDSGDLPR